MSLIRALTFAKGSVPEPAPSRMAAEMRPASCVSASDLCSRASFRRRFTTSKFARSMRVRRWESLAPLLPSSCTKEVAPYASPAAPLVCSVIASFAAARAFSSSARLFTEASWSDTLVAQSLFMVFRTLSEFARSFFAAARSPSAAALASEASCCASFVSLSSLLSALIWSWSVCPRSSKLCLAAVSSLRTSSSCVAAFCFRSSSTSTMLSLRDL
mmetsp:Transcript_33760/g.107212  ORF Transcript_33760/g.107212 Transcript_33760/m.107212 type:complete len:215 (-) Transcript_33760:348-992(-)